MSDIRKDIDKAPTEHQDREGATQFSGFQPNSVFADQGSTDSETSITKEQRGKPALTDDQKASRNSDNTAPGSTWTKR